MKNQKKNASNSTRTNDKGTVKKLVDGALGYIVTSVLNAVAAANGNGEYAHALGLVGYHTDTLRLLIAQNASDEQICKEAVAACASLGIPASSATDLAAFVSALVTVDRAAAETDIIPDYIEAIQR